MNRNERAIAVLGGAGFLGNALCRKLLSRNSRVICVDDLSSGSVDNIADLATRSGFTFIESDVSRGLRNIPDDVACIVNMASAASPADYLANPIETLVSGSAGTLAALEAAKRAGCRFVLTSTSEVYGDPTVVPQPESYFGNVNPIGPRSVYDEAKRFAEAATSAFRREYGVNTGIVRIFNTYGPGMRRNDGRLIPSLIDRALTNSPQLLTGDGMQTRTLCYVDDMVDALIRMTESNHPGPINLGGEGERTVSEIASIVREHTGASSEIVYTERPEDDPERRCPSLGLARQVLGWQPTTGITEGVARTIAWCRESPLWRGRERTPTVRAGGRHGTNLDA